MFLEFLQPIWPCFEKKKNHFPRLHYRKYFCYQSKLKEIRVFIESLKLFAQNPWNIIDMVFNSIFVKRKMQYDSLLSKQKPCHRVINWRSSNPRMAPKFYFQFHWNYNQPRVEAKKSLLNCETYLPLFPEITYMILKIGMLLCRTGSNFYTKNRVLDFQPNFFWPGCISIFEFMLAVLVLLALKSPNKMRFLYFDL